MIWLLPAISGMIPAEATLFNCVSDIIHHELPLKTLYYLEICNCDVLNSIIWTSIEIFILADRFQNNIEVSTIICIVKFIQISI